MNLTDEDRAGLEALLRSDGYDRSVAARAQIVLWWADGHAALGIAQRARTTKPTVYKWVKRYSTKSTALTGWWTVSPREGLRRFRLRPERESSH